MDGPRCEPGHNAGVDQVVVGAAVVRRGTVLAARRTSPADAVGRWEFPGGKVEQGESPETALVREISEELGCGVVVTDWLALAVPVRAGLTLRVAVARLADGDPSPREHEALRWVGPDELEDLDWLEPDRPFLTELRDVLRRPQPRGILDDKEAAEDIAAALRLDGFDAWTEREAFHGEDDDEAHAWAVLSDAPGFRLELLLEEHDGWYDDGEPHATSPPLDLPRSPRR